MTHRFPDIRFLKNIVTLKSGPDVTQGGTWSVAYLRGALVRGPDRRDFCNYFGIIFSDV